MSNLPLYLLGVSEETAVNFEEGWQTVRLKDRISVKKDETYIPIKIAGNTSVYSTSDTAANRMAVPYTMTEDGYINSISIYHNSCFVA